MNFAQVKGITIPQGVVKQLSQGQTTLWKKRGGVLPADYRELIGIDFDGDFHYETGEKLYGSDVITITLDNTSTTGQNVFGSYNGTASGRKNFSLYVYGNGSSSNSYLRYGESLYRPKYGTGKRTLVFGGNGTTDGFTTDVDITPDTFVTDVQAFIGWLPNSSSPHYTGDIVGRITAGDRLIWIPVERQSDGEIGYYELNSGVFITKTGTGTPVSLGYVDNPLPTGAIACDLICADGYSAFINTSLIPSASMSYEVDVCWAKADNALECLFGYMINSVRYAPLLRETYLEPQYNYWYETDWAMPSGVVRYHHKVIASPIGTTIRTYTPDGQTLLDTRSVSYSQSVTFIQTIGLFGRKSSATAISNGSGRSGLGRIKCYDDDHFGHLVADFIPCYYNGNFGMWEAVSQTMLTGNTPANIRGYGSHWNTAGFFPNARNTDTQVNRTNYLAADRDFDTSRMLAIPTGCTTIRFNSGSPINGTTDVLNCFDANEGFLGWYPYNEADKQITLPANTAFVRLSMYHGQMDNCYVYDVTNSQYIWRGSNV